MARIQKLSSLAGYILQAESTATFNPADATTYYLGSLFALGANSTPGTRRIYVPKSGTIRSCLVYFNNGGTLGSNESSAVSLRLNNSVDTLISNAVTNDAATTLVSNLALAIPVVVGDYLELKWACPTWATNPTSVRVSGLIVVS